MNFDHRKFSRKEKLWREKNEEEEVGKEEKQEKK